MRKIFACGPLLLLLACGGSATGTSDADRGQQGGSEAGGPDASSGEDATSQGLTVLAVTLMGDGKGAVRSDPSGIDCGTTCAATFAVKAVHLTAIPSSGSDFAGWTGGCTGSALTCDVPLGIALLTTVLASFALQRGELTVVRNGTGTGTVAGPGIQCGGTCSASPVSGMALRLTAAPDTGSVFSGWSGCASVAGSECDVSPVEGQPVTVTATFSTCPVPAPGGTRYVDHDNGADDTLHGGAAGTCAFKTVTYGLAHATERIVLAPGDYPGKTADPTPYVLTGRQVLVGDVTDAGKVVMAPGGPPSNLRYGAIFAGTRNGVDHCTISGDSNGTMGLLVSALASTSADPHFLTNSVVKGLSDIMWVQRAAGNILIQGNTFMSTSSGGIQWDPVDATGSLIGNSFVATAADMNCTAGANPSLTGRGNARGGGPISCFGCQGCPFQ
jgi:hypothetical protein